MTSKTDYVTKTDEGLVRLTKEGDLLAANALIERYASRVKCVARAFYLQKGGELDDLVQEGMFALWNAIGSYREGEGATFSTFATLCVQRKIISAVKKATAKKRGDYLSDCSLSEEEIEKQLPTAVTPEAIYEGKEVAAELFSALTELERTVLRLYLDGYSYGEIAEKMNKNAKAVDNAVQRIRKKLHPFYGE